MAIFITDTHQVDGQVVATRQVDVTAPATRVQLHQQARDVLALVPAAIAARQAFINLASPTNAQVVAELKAADAHLIKVTQCVAKLIALTLNLDGAADLLNEATGAI